MDNIASNNTNMPSSGLVVQQEIQPRSSLFPLYNTISFRTTRIDSFLMGWRLDRSRMSATATGTQNPTAYHPFREMKPCLAIVPYMGLHRHVNMNSQRQHCDWLPLLYGKRLINLKDTPSLPRFGLSGALRPEVLVEIRCSINYFKEITALVKVLALNVTVGLSQNELLARFKTSKLTRWNTFSALAYGDSQYGETNTDVVRTELEKICPQNETIVEIKRSTKTTNPHNLPLIDNADKALSGRRGLPPSTGFKKWRKSKSRTQKTRKAIRIPSSSFHSSRNINMKRPLSIPSMVSPQDLQHQPPNKIFVSMSGIVRRHKTCLALQLEQYPSAGRRLFVQTIVKEDDLCAMFNESLANIFKKNDRRNGTDKKEEKSCENCRLKPHRVKSTLNVKAMDDCSTAPRGGQDHDGRCDQRKSLEAVSSLATLQRMFSGDAIHALLQMLRPPPMPLKDYQKALQRIKVDINVLRRKFRKKIRKIQRIVRKRPFTSSSAFSACSTTETNHPPNKIFVSGNGISPRHNTSEFNGFGEDSTVSENDIDKLCTLFEACSTTTGGNSKEIGRN
ncbi:hypothetical protein AC249_AIPGENE20446 [Exaiptasia diaphana]|nr:hypothetical protein AC249_AIPGENE20446 [Exaiptasia diaphana]